MPACGPFVRPYRILGKVCIALGKKFILSPREERLALFHEEGCSGGVSIQNVPVGSILLLIIDQTERMHSRNS